MKVAIPCTDAEGKEISKYFGRARYFYIYDTKSQEGGLVRIPYITVLPGDALKFLESLNVDAVVVNTIGNRSREYLQKRGIKVLEGFDGKVEDIISNFISRFAEPSVES
ncbi:hypothetical protein Asulf_00866 [Archaeoglobus sulfaticallidus PM70-1]|uniref:Dinitrogenase iron-molybdenum cofactor biosynthesis domain-containing protein n=1 Tax=Archaeoglobus sulfaticallidus PM70-1 TaxID=387631 RepID=N0BCY2_9EURY|nr:NifB/NifX family molybdenum-iron cluster-binding protein [Archaeoglobus sulfaticallidus]AGK60873.1 hypothetical protein Asulf_00866 [Archaeoglobus sulfaticallidus PM70-1]